MKIDRLTAAERQRQARFLKLVDRRREQHPTETYADAFNAVMSSEGQQLAAEMHIANAVPVQ